MPTLSNRVIFFNQICIKSCFHFSAPGTDDDVDMTDYGPMIPDYGKVPNNKTPIVSSKKLIYF